MSIEEFTKGPWVRVDAVFDFASEVYFGDSLICVVTSASGVEPEHNANLIAAAPEMYAMLNEISDGLLDAGGYGNCALAKRIEKLLAKARGE